jgi:hypothetical protein
VIAAGLTLASGSIDPASQSRAIRPGFGDSNPPRAGAAMVVLSTGSAAAPGDINPSQTPFQGGTNTGTSSAAPADWLAANGGAFPNAPGCPEAASSVAYDPVMLSLRVRVPSNAASFSVSTSFFSSEYPEWVCSPYNDFFVVLLDSSFDGSPPNRPTLLAMRPLHRKGSVPHHRPLRRRRRPGAGAAGLEALAEEAEHRRLATGSRSTAAAR